LNYDLINFPVSGFDPTTNSSLFAGLYSEITKNKDARTRKERNAFLDGLLKDIFELVFKLYV